MSAEEEEMDNLKRDTRIAGLLANLSGASEEHSRKAERICRIVAEKFFPEHTFFFTALGALHDIGDLILPYHVLHQEHIGAWRRNEEEYTMALRAGYLFLRSVHPDLADLVLHHHEIKEYAEGTIEFPDSNKYPKEARVVDIVGQKFVTLFMMTYLDPEKKKTLGLAMAAIEEMLEYQRIDKKLAEQLTAKFPQFLEMQKIVLELLDPSTS